MSVRMRKTSNQLVVDTLRISRGEWENLLSRIDRREARTAKPGLDRRTGVRARSRCTRQVLIELHHPGGSRTFYRVFSRNISIHGLGFIHGQFLHAGSEAVIALTDNAGKLVTISGRIAHCRHVEGKVHEVGVAFDDAIDLKQFLAPAGKPELRAAG